MYSRPLFLQTHSDMCTKEHQSGSSLADQLAVTVLWSAADGYSKLVIEAKYSVIVMTRQHVRMFAAHLSQAISFLAQCASLSTIQDQSIRPDLSLEEEMACVDAEVRDLSARICFLSHDLSSEFPGELRVTSTVTALTYAQAQLVEADVDFLVHDLDTAEATYFYARADFEGVVHIQMRENRGRTAPVLCGSPIPQSPIVACLRPGWFVTPCRGDPSTESEEVVCLLCLTYVARSAKG